MNENVGAILLLNEPKALGVIEPLHLTLCHLSSLLYDFRKWLPVMTGIARRSYQGFWEQKGRKSRGLF
jgi:hypothetical protein